MSVATGNKGEKAKKFQSLNINNIYQVSIHFNTARGSAFGYPSNLWVRAWKN